jgi:hypothetical protein
MHQTFNPITEITGIDASKNTIYTHVHVTFSSKAREQTSSKFLKNKDNFNSHQESALHTTTTRQAIDS